MDNYKYHFYNRKVDISAVIKGKSQMFYKYSDTVLTTTDQAFDETTILSVFDSTAIEQLKKISYKIPHLCYDYTSFKHRFYLFYLFYDETRLYIDKVQSITIAITYTPTDSPRIYNLSDYRLDDVLEYIKERGISLEKVLDK